MAAEAALDLGDPADFAIRAASALEEGFDSPALRVLAGLESPDRGEAMHWLDRALRETGTSRPDRSRAVRTLALEVCREIRDGQRAAYEGAKRIWDLSLLVTDVREFDPFIYAASEWEGRPEDRAFFDNEIRLEARRQTP